MNKRARKVCFCGACFGVGTDSKADGEGESKFVLDEGLDMGRSDE